jgi:hypothetical protein
MNESSFRFQNRRTKWKKTENISNVEAAEYKLGTRKMSSTSSSSFDHNRNQSVQVPIGDSTSSKSSTCSSTSSRRSNERISNVPPPSSIPLLFFNPFSHLLQSSSLITERCSSVSPSSSTRKENKQCSSSHSTSINDSIEDHKGNENMKLKHSIESRPCSR